jgi:hypothetical protein
MVREHVGPIEKLSDASRAQRMVWMFCLNCGHGAACLDALKKPVGRG